MMICFLAMAVMSYAHKNEEKTESENLKYMPYSFLNGVLFGCIAVGSWAIVQTSVRKLQEVNYILILHVF